MYVTRHMEPVVLEVSSQYPALLIEIGRAHV